MPGFGGTRELPRSELSFAGYGSWAARFLESLGIGDVALVAGHSFGGGVATQFAHDHPGRCGSLLLANAIGSPVWELFAEEVHTMAARPVWDWGRHLGRELWAAPGFFRMVPAIVENLVPNLMSNPLALWRIGEFIRRADLSGELAVLAARGLPVEVLWSDRDGLVPRSAFDEIRRAVGVEGTVVEGPHSWLLANAGPFGEAAVRCLVDAGVVGASQLRPAL
jgi:pimeloyl-ACP methyl ester carboxylesterase